MSVCLAHFVVTAEATVDDLQCLFSQTPANIVVVSYHDWKDKDHTVERTLEQAVKVNTRHYVPGPEQPLPLGPHLHYLLRRLDCHGVVSFSLPERFKC